jgi:hypothetical protein
MKSGFTSLVTESFTYDKEGVGVLRVENNKIYRFVKNAETDVTFSAGNMVSHVLTNGTTSLNSVKKAATANLGYLAGACVSTLEANTGTNPKIYGWILVQGIGSVSVSGATTGGTDIAAGDYLKGVNAQSYVVRDAATSPIYGRNVQILTAVGTTTTPAAAAKDCFVRCLQ